MLWCCLVVLAALAGLGQAHPAFKVEYQWVYVNYTWPSREAYLKADKDGAYDERTNVVSGIKVWKDKMYLTVPRWKAGVPVTLSVTSAVPVNGQTAPKLEPFPSWEMQRIGDCSAFQFVQNVEIDPKGRMWVLDTGRAETMNKKVKPIVCPPRLVILDLEDGGKLLLSHEFSNATVNAETAYLNDLVIDHEDGGVAYITDTDDLQPGIIVFSLRNNSDWKVRHGSMLASPEAVGFKISMQHVSQRFHVKGLALSPASTEGQRVLYYTPLSSYYLFSVPTRVLKDRALSDDINRYVKVLGRKPSQTDGMVMSNTGVLYFGLLADDAVSMWDTKEHPNNFTVGQRIISRDHHLLVWPDSFGFDNKGGLWCLTNQLHTFFDGTLTFDKANFRAILSKVDMKSYQYYENGTAPEIPGINGAVKALASQAVGHLLAILLVVLLQ